jgi:hypothetical protein
MTKNQGVWVRRLRFLAQLAKAFCPGSDDRRALRKFARFDPTPEAGARSFLFLQGPQSPFMRRLGLAMHSLGVKVLRINVCGGDVYHWPRPLTLCYRGSRLDWPAFVATVMDRHGVTDLILIGDKRPLNHDAICLARARGIAVHVLEEGYLRPSYITMERGGVNSNSSLPPTPEAVRALAATLPDLPRPSRIVDSMSVRVVSTIKHHVGNTVLFGFFPATAPTAPMPSAWSSRAGCPAIFPASAAGAGPKPPWPGCSPRAGRFSCFRSSSIRTCRCAPIPISACSTPSCTCCPPSPGARRTTACFWSKTIPWTTG